MNNSAIGRSFRARAFANLALVKYFGKRDTAYNLPAAGSLSLVLFPLETTTSIELSSDLESDEVLLDGSPASQAFQNRVSAFLNIIRDMSGRRDKAKVSTSNTFPTAAGLASSASGFAALTVAASSAFDLELSPFEMSALARRGSGSAARSISGGIAVWHRGNREDGSDSFAESIASAEEWDLRVIIGLTQLGPKAIGSTQAMERARISSPYYRDWIESCATDLNDAVSSVERRDFTLLGEITERSALSMHAVAFSARPGIVFWNGATVEALQAIRQLRASGIEAYFTCDAGPQPKALCLPDNENAVVAVMSQLPGIIDIIRCGLGPGAALF